MEMADTSAVDLQRAAFGYFSRTSYISKRILAEEKTFLKHLGNQWNELPTKHRNDLLDLLFVDDPIRASYHSCYADRVAAADVVQESFPRLYISSGNKINVDFENDLWTWRDEHSGPFSWMSRSQQDLTLLDLEPENISKPQPKSLRGDTDDDKVQKVAEPQFTQPSSSWCHSIVDDFRKNEQNVVLTPSNSMTLLGVTTDSSNDDDANLDGGNPATSCQPRVSSQGGVTDGSNSFSASDKKYDGKDKNRSPSPKKIVRTGSFKKSPSKNVDSGEQKLIVCDEPEMDDRTNAFSNPVMESEWSNFVGPTGDDLSSNTQDSPVTSAPESMAMDRGSDVSCSPKGEYISLIEQSYSPARTSSRTVTSPAISEWSAQSTPDHTTHLLKGMQSPVHHRHPVPQPIKLSSANCKDLPAELETEESEEVLRVEKEGDKIVVTTQVENKRDSDIPVTGFDFLDEW
ncbi:unnamed protein product [Candidula unifasciata]|uniref:DUF4706 domain-containing protein n=1 Tax=Candidula unifasciata TaxID=100452 RepID=A0A8S3ZW40_9EUPU|nr:unnamed protein product [Candidula unifasciata]